MKFCPECTAVLATKNIGGVERKLCIVPGCGFVHWDNPVPVVAALLLSGDGVLLGRNAQWPSDMFSMLTGYLERGETPEAAVIREVKEEVGMDGEIQMFLGLHSLMKKNQLIIAYAVAVRGEATMSEEISEVKFLSRAALRQWDFGPLGLTKTIVQTWLSQTDASHKR